MNQKKLNQLAIFLNKSIPTIRKITDGNGFSIEKKVKFYPKARKSAINKKSIKIKGSIWMPLIENNKTLLVCNLEEEISINQTNLINTFFEQFKKNFLLEMQVKKTLTPKNNFIKKIILSNRIKTMKKAIEYGDILGIDLRPPYSAIVINSKNYKKNINPKSVKDKTKTIDDVIATELRQDTILILRHAEKDNNTKETEKYFIDKLKSLGYIFKNNNAKDIKIGIGSYYPKINGLRKSFHEAEIAIEVGSKIFENENIYKFADLGIFTAISKKTTFNEKQKLARIYLAGIVENPDLKKSTEAILNNDLDISAAAKSLNIHRNTLIYRTKKIKKITGMDPKKFQDAVKIKLGLDILNIDTNSEAWIKKEL